MNALELVANVSDSLGWGDVDSLDTDDASNRKILRHANLVMASMQGERKWKELEAKGNLVTQARVTLDSTSSTSVVYGQSSVTLGVSVATIRDFTGGLVRYGGAGEWYRLLGIDRNTGETEMDRPYVGTSFSGVGTEIEFVRDSYQLPDDYDRLNTKKMYDRTNLVEIELVDDAKLDYIQSLGITPQPPKYFAIRGRTPAGNSMISFDSPPDDVYMYSFSYQRNHPELVKDSDEVLYPIRYNLALVDQIAARLNRDTEDQQKVIADAAAALAERVRQEANPDDGDRPLQMQPWTGRV